jgi:hypothetical protein
MREKHRDSLLRYLRSSICWVRPDVEARLAASRLRICSLASSASFLALNREHSSSPTLVSEQVGKS